MKKTRLRTVTSRILLASLLLLVGVVSITAKEKKSTEKVTFVTSLDCESCKNKIMKAIPYEKGVKSVEVTIESKEVALEFRSDKNSVEGLKKAIEELGYTAKVKKECCKSEDSKGSKEHDHDEDKDKDDHKGHDHD